jgi:hypothetical protein
MENIINKLGHSRLLEYFLIMWIVTLVAIKLIDRSMYYILVLTEKKKELEKIQWFCLWLYHNIKIWSNNALLDSILYNVQKRLS